jgi:hypothetical protein
MDPGLRVTYVRGSHRTRRRYRRLQNFSAKRLKLNLAEVSANREAERVEVLLELTHLLVAISKVVGSPRLGDGTDFAFHCHRSAEFHAVTRRLEGRMCDDPSIIVHVVCPVAHVLRKLLILRVARLRVSGPSHKIELPREGWKEALTRSDAFAARSMLGANLPGSRGRAIRLVL